MQHKATSQTRPARLGRPLDAWSSSGAPADGSVWWKSSLAFQAVIVLIGLIVFFTNLGSATLFDMDEALYSTCAREMTARGDWVVPWFNGQMFPDKPPLMYWLMMAGRSVFGPTEFAVRLQAALFGIATALATYHLGRLLFCREVGFWAGVIVSTSIVFTISARAATVDSALTFAITAAMLTWVATAPAWRGKIPSGTKSSARDIGQRCPRKPRHWAIAALWPRHPHVEDSQEYNLPAYLPRGWLAFALIYAFVAVAVLAKGPVGLIMALGAIGLFLLMVDRIEKPANVTSGQPSGRLASWLRPVLGLLRRLAPARIIRAGWKMRPLTAIIVILAIAAPWYVLVALRTDGKWIEGFLAMNFGPATKAIQGHSGPWFYHLLVVFAGFFPWCVFIGPMLIGAARRVKANHPWRPGYVFALCWAVAIIGLWSAVALKLPHHILPAYPALALLAATFVHRWIAEPAAVNRWWMRNASIILIVVGAGLAVALPIVTMIFLPGEGWIGLAGVPLVIGGVACLWFSERRQTARTMAAFTASAVAFLTFAFGFAVLGVDRYQNGPPLAAAIHRAEPEEPELATFCFFRESFVYYTGEHVERIKTEEDLEAFLAKSLHPFVITTDEHVAWICQRFRPQRVAHQRRKFMDLDMGQLVVLEWEPSAVPRTAGKPKMAR